MEKIEYKQLKETLYHERLANGLEVYILPKTEFSKTYATFTTKYGSIDDQFDVEGKGKFQVPDGVAHFLEHKMFEQESGEDVFQTFSRQGASANAFTSFTRTAYLFSCTEQVDQNVNTLLDYVQSPYFTTKNVEKEKGIIGQEIRMYDDNPDWRSYFGLIEGMYQKHPVRIDIAGTIESIGNITDEILYDCYNTFYHPSNMLFFIAGPVEPEEMLKLIVSNQKSKSFTEAPQIKRYIANEPGDVAIKDHTISLPVSVPKCLFGFKESNSYLNQTADQYLKQEFLTEMMLEALVGRSSTFYQTLYDEGLIDESFSYSYTLEQSFGFSMMGGDTHHPDELVARFKSEVPTVLEQGIDYETFERIKKKKIGSILRYFNSPEWIANQFTNYRFNGADLFQMIPVLESLRIEDLNDRLHQHIAWDRFTVSKVLSPES
ncbi:insulinase family protein [Hazenella sp. IB182353]|uniref:EF-P 5-aminopentanol modification-associated protein YfmH n=1 Tax=Polycladospora coralii TaxID=2771432 RepID=UPI0017461EDF|nr:pitrilysin family protein [Polycladospora coralii]MBS7530832.1 insulinase family protein [Polycladospora coralii]